jgi:hypothetical protein
MNRKKMLFLMVLMLLVACPVFAQAPGGSGMGPGEVKFLGGMLGLGIAGGLCGHRAQPRSRCWNPVRADSWLGVY